MARAGADVEEFARHMEENCLSAGGGDGRPRLLWRRCSFRHEMESGFREGEELRKVWSKLRQEEAAWLEEEVQCIGVFNRRQRRSAAHLVMAAHAAG